jgi:hypothetical protein
MSSFWRAAADDLPTYILFLKAVMTNSPNSCPPERAFSILNNSFDEDQGSSLADYKEYSIMAQYNARGR